MYWGWLLPIFVLGLHAVVTVSAADSTVDIRGVAPKEAYKYIPFDRDGVPMWKCLGSDKVIPFAQVNDDYCDCPDGSDEPGTSACPNGQFYCQNKGFIGSYIRSSRVNDGVCEPECCDGSDETDGKISCPNICAKVNKEFQHARMQEQKVHDAGAKVRAKYINEYRHYRAQASAELVRLESLLIELTAEEKTLREALALAEQEKNYMEEQKRKSPLYEKLESRNGAIRSLARALENAVGEMRVLAKVVESLDTDDAPPAVTGALQSYSEWLGENHQGLKASLDERLAELMEWAPPISQLESMADENVFEMMDGAPEKGTIDTRPDPLTHLPSYLPEGIIPMYQKIVTWMVRMLVHLDILHPVHLGVHTASGKSVSEAQAALDACTQKIQDTERDVKTHKKDATDDDAKYGRDGEFKALQDQCVSKDMGSYTYEMCFGGTAWQVSNNDGFKFNLGRFDHFDVDNKFSADDERHYLSMLYAHGQTCWNGPPRSTRVSLECGAENALLHVFEAEKCTYSMRVTTPAVCFPRKSMEELIDEARIDHEEL